MNILIFGASGMVGQGVLRECLAAGDVDKVVSVGRKALGQTHVKLEELVLGDLTQFEPVEAKLSGFDACYFCLGVSSGGMSEADYTRLTYDLTTQVAETLARLNPQMTFVYVSGSGTDSSEKGRTLWARIKGRTENALLKMPFKAAFMFRPGIIVPMDGIESKTATYRILYKILGPLLPLFQWLMPGKIMTTRSMGQAMLKVTRSGAQTPVLEAEDLNALLN